MPPTLPSTPSAAPPNFYSAVGQLGAGQPGAGQGGQAPASQPNSPGGTPDPQAAQDQEFLENTTKLLGILQKMGAMTPKGQDISKYTKAAAQAMEDCIKNVYHQNLGVGNGSAGS